MTNANANETKNMGNLLVNNLSLAASGQEFITFSPHSQSLTQVLAT